MQNTSSYQVWRIAPKDVEYIWPDIERFILAADENFQKFSDLPTVKQVILDNTIDLWVGFKDNEITLVGLTAVLGNLEKYLDIIWIGGTHFKQLYPKGMEKFELWAALHGAKTIRASGKRKLQRVLARHGFEVHRVEMSKTISFNPQLPQEYWRH